MKPKIHAILSTAIENGIRRGWRRSHKHCENPDEEFIFDELENCIMGNILEYFSFDADEY
jgi:hypothetical protein